MTEGGLFGASGGGVKWFHLLLCSTLGVSVFFFVCLVCECIRVYVCDLFGASGGGVEWFRLLLFSTLGVSVFLFRCARVCVCVCVHV